MEAVLSHPPSSLSPPAMTPAMTPVDDDEETFFPTVSMQDLERAEPATEGSKNSQRKRKSWGQVLPEPKTNLPPRKRAKTDDEKEQRRIERVKRNRLAAHNSRERKRQETEDLQRQNDELQAQLRLMHDQIAQMQSQLRAYEQGGTPPASRSSFSSAATVDPRDDSLSREGSVESLDAAPVASKSSPRSPLIKVESETATLMPDLTQHSAAMLCEDLQCRSGSTSAGDLSTMTSLPSSQNWIPVAIFSLISLNIRLCFQSLLLTTWLTFPNWTNRMLSLTSRQNQQSAPNTRPHPSRPRSRHLPWDRTTSSPLSRHRSPLPSTTTSTSTPLATSPAPSSWRPQPQPQPQQQQTLQMTLAQGFPSMQTLAQHLLLATSLSSASAFSAGNSASFAAAEASAAPVDHHESESMHVDSPDVDTATRERTLRLEEMWRALCTQGVVEHLGRQGHSGSLDIQHDVNRVSEILGMYLRDWSGTQKGVDRHFAHPKYGR